MKCAPDAVENVDCCAIHDEAERGLDLQNVTFLCQLMCDPNRLKVFASLLAGERCVQDIVSEVGLHQNLVSHHLAVLRKAGLVKTRRDGHWICYSVNKDLLAQISPALKRVFDPEAERA